MLHSLWPCTQTLARDAVGVSSERDGGTLLVMPPTSDPMTSPAKFPEEITAESYQVPSSGLSLEEQDSAMEETLEVMQTGKELMLGFMTSRDYESPRYLKSPLTNVMGNIPGDPFTVSRPRRHVPKWIEQNVLDYFASLWNAKWPHDPADPDSYWGYVLAMGSSEGNLHALWSARKYLTTGLSNMDGSAAQPVLFCSQYANFSIAKLANIVNLKQFHEVGVELYPDQNPLRGDWVKGVLCTGGDAGPGTVDIDALEKLVDFFSAKGHPIVVVFNYGTTVKGGCDDVKSAGERLVEVLKKNNMYERTFQDPSDPSKCVMCKGFWFHVDGALGAAYMPFLEMAFKNGLTDVEPASVFDFRLDFVSSIVTSGHKYIGTPWPCGVYLTRNSLLCSNDGKMSVAGVSDTTLSLSRNAHSAMHLWSFVASNSFHKQVADIVQCQRTVRYAVRKLQELERWIGIDLMIMNFTPSLSIMFRKPNAQLVLKYTLMVTSLQIESKKKEFAQIYIMRHVTTEKFDAFVADLESPDAFPYKFNYL